jgi:hypothetical protein
MFRCRQQLLPKRRRLSTRCNSWAAVHVALVNAFARNTVAVLEQYVMPEHLGEALDKLHALQAAAVPGTVGRRAQPGMRHADWFQVPGVASVDRVGIVRWLQQARHSGDIPSPATVIAALPVTAGG